MNISDFRIGNVYIRRDLIEAFKGSFMRGMNTCLRTNSLVLISKELPGRIYGDGWRDGILRYIGEGQSGDQTLTGANKTLAESNETKIPVYLFVVREAHKYIYFGKVRLCDKPVQEHENDVNHIDRLVWCFPLRLETDAIPSTGLSQPELSSIRPGQGRPSIKPEINVVGAAIQDDGKILCAQRGYGSLKGKWEFPGGKVEEGESEEEALKREIKEELGIDITIESHIGDSSYDYSDASVNLSLYSCKIRAGQKIHDITHQSVAMKTPEEMITLDWADADVPLVEDAVDTLPSHIEGDPVHFNYLESKPLNGTSTKRGMREVQNYEAAEREKIKHGNEAEIAVIDYEKDKLRNAGRPELAAGVNRVSTISSDYGYDVESFEILGDGTIKPIRIEVKFATKTTNTITFFISKNELENFLRKDPFFRIYCLYRNGRYFKLHIVDGNQWKSEYLTPMTYKVTIRISN